MNAALEVGRGHRKMAYLLSARPARYASGAVGGHAKGAIGIPWRNSRDTADDA